MKEKRTISEIKEEISKHLDIVRDLENELEDIKKNCPHPDYFVTVERIDYEDDCGGPGIYEHSVVRYVCSLCEGKFYGQYDKNKEKSPTLQEVLEEG